ncbi:MAG: glycosyltransferase family 4 protein [Pseudohongiella sp.]|nr:glycosyltransferase family 4 protein [Pseudohongiella sp.]
MVHNFYGSGSPSGENIVFEVERNLLEQNGHEIRIFARYSDDIICKGMLGKIEGAISVPWNPFTVRDIKKVIDDFKPDVVHVHNTFPLISPSVFHAVGKKAAKVLTLHNYRLFCPAAIPMREGRVCTECIDKRSVMPAIEHGCYRKSRIATAPLATSVALHRMLGTWRTKVDAFIALTKFQRDLMTSGGLVSEKIHIKPNFYPGNPEIVPFISRSIYVVYVGRLSEEKGVLSLIKAWQMWGSTAPKLKIIGDGPLRNELQSLVGKCNIEFLGQIPYEETQAQIANAQLLVLPSECFEGFPMVVREAFALGTPVAVSNLGPLPSIVNDGFNGVLFEAGNPHSMISKVRNLMDNCELLANLASGARNSFETLYNEKANHRILIEIYEKAIAANLRSQN